MKLTRNRKQESGWKKYSFVFGLGLFLIVNGCTTLGSKARPAARPALQEPGQKVLATGRRLVWVEKKLYRSNCYVFVDAVYTEAGYPKARRKTVFRGGAYGPYADVDMLRPGDWVMHINHEFHGVGHSSIFVTWIDKESKLAMTLDHAGLYRVRPGKYREHRLSSVFCVIRPEPAQTVAAAHTP